MFGGRPSIPPTGLASEEPQLQPEVIQIQPAEKKQRFVVALHAKPGARNRLAVSEGRFKGGHESRAAITSLPRHFPILAVAHRAPDLKQDRRGLHLAGVQRGGRR